MNDRELILEEAKIKVQMMVSTLEFAAMLLHPVIGASVVATLKDTNPRMLAKLQKINASLWGEKS